jgi:hypothetical protein
MPTDVQVDRFHAIDGAAETRTTSRRLPKVSRAIPWVELRGFEPLTFSLRRLRPDDGTTLEAAAGGAWRA